MLATFLFSGLVHEALWLTIFGEPMYAFALFFTTNGGLVLGEGLIRQHLSRSRSRMQRGFGALHASMASSTLLAATLPHPVIQVIISAAVYFVLLGLAGLLVWPRLAPAIGKHFLGESELSFEELHARLLVWL